MTDDRTEPPTADRPTVDRSTAARDLTTRRRLVLLYAALLLVDAVALVRRVRGYRSALDRARPHRTSR